MSGTRAAPAAWKLRDPARADAACLALITVLSALPYLFYLGFYSDDWGLLALFSEPRTSLATLAHDFVERPVQGAYLLLLFKLFGVHALGYHIVNTLVLAASASLLFLILLRLRLGRPASFSATLLFLMLPQLSTVRVWYAAFQIPLALLLSLISMHCQLSFARSGRAGWLAAAIVSAALSIGAYEIFAPLIAGFGVTLGWLNRRDTRQAWILAAVISTTLVAGAVYKLTLSGRAGPVGDPNRYLLGLRQLVRLDYDWRVDSGLNIVATPWAYFWAPVEGWWTGARMLFSGGVSGTVMVIACVIAALAWWRLSRRESTIDDFPSAKRMLQLGVAAFVLGNATFLIVPAVVFTSTGMGNRVQVAAAIGVAMIFAALIAIAASATGERRHGAAFSILVVAISVAAFVRLAQIERYWAEAPALQERVLRAARVDLRALPAHSTVILDGVCPYHGPAVVFEEAWDVGGALTLALGRTLRGEAVSPRMSLTPTGLETSIYKEPSFYPYGPELYVYNPARHVLLRLTDREAAARYFATRSPSHCPTGFVARGVEV